MFLSIFYAHFEKKSQNYIVSIKIRPKFLRFGRIILYSIRRTFIFSAILLIASQTCSFLSSCTTSTKGNTTCKSAQIVELLDKATEFERKTRENKYSKSQILEMRQKSQTADWESIWDHKRTEMVQDDTYLYPRNCWYF